jgi:hypothetical protein
MSEYFGFKIDASTLAWSKGESYMQSAHAPKEQKLAELLRALQMANLEGARHCFIALINAAPYLANHALMSQLSSALQSSNMPWAQKIGKEIKALGLKVFDHSTTINPSIIHPSNFQAAQKAPHVDIQA